MITSILTYIGAVVGILSALSMALHIFGLDKNKYVKVFLSVSNDIIGAYKGYAAVKASNQEEAANAGK